MDKIEADVKQNESLHKQILLKVHGLQHSQGEFAKLSRIKIKGNEDELVQLQQELREACSELG